MSLRQAVAQFFGIALVFTAVLLVIWLGSPDSVRLYPVLQEYRTGWWLIMEAALVGSGAATVAGVRYASNPASLITPLALVSYLVLVANSRVIGLRVDGAWSETLVFLGVYLPVGLLIMTRGDMLMNRNGYRAMQPISFAHWCAFHLLHVVGAIYAMATLGRDRPKGAYEFLTFVLVTSLAAAIIASGTKLSALHDRGYIPGPRD